MQITFQDLLNQIDDLGQNYTVSNIDLGNKKRAANRGFEHVQRRLGLPSDKRVHSFWFYQDQLFYDAPAAFNELIQLVYNSTEAGVVVNNNDFARRWFPVNDIEILRNSGTIPVKNLVAPTSVNGKNQMILKGRNTKSSVLINPFNSLVGLSFSPSISNAEVDSNVYRENGASVKFDVDGSESTSSITINGSWDVRQFINGNGAYRWYVDFPIGVDTGIFSSVGVELHSANGYYSMVTTKQYDGSDWNEGTWSKLSFALQSAIASGSPDASNITSIVLKFNHAGGFSPVQNMRVNTFFLVQPDLMEMIYYSAIKGTDSTGTVDRIILEDGSDILSFGSIAPDLIMPIALKAALILWPQLRGDSTFWQMYSSEYTDTMKTLGRTYPRQRTNKALSTELIR